MAPGINTPGAFLLILLTCRVLSLTGSQCVILGAVMYFATVLLLMLVLPVVSVVSEAVFAGNADLLFLVGRWFVFWGVGLRLLLAGLKQVAQPSFTAEKIFGVTDEKAFPLVQEIGFGNLSIGLLGAASLFQPNWVVPAALVGCIFFGLAGLKHLTQPSRNRSETIAMLSDIGISAVLAIYLAAHVLTFAA